MQIKYIKDEKKCIENSPKSADFLYENKLGNIILKIMNKKFISSISGWYMNSLLSKTLIKSFIKNNNIDMNEYQEENYSSFNDFFTRKIKKEARKISLDKDDLISPADSKLLIYKIDNNLEVNIKDTPYKMVELLRNDKLVEEYRNGFLLVFRLCVDDYHRYIFIDDGKIVETKKINGLFHTVGPIAFKKHKVFKENQREYTVIDTNNFEKIIQMEVGAMMVGKIHNHKKDLTTKGEEKGYFLFGGSTIVIFTKNIVKLDKNILKYSEKGIEVKVKLGQTIGRRMR